MTEPRVTATVLNPGDHDGPWDFELVLTSPDGGRVDAQTITCCGMGEWDAKAGPTMLRFRAIAERKGWVERAVPGALHALQPTHDGGTTTPT